MASLSVVVVISVTPLDHAPKTCALAVNYS
jgi:hypothetical protein